MTGALLYQPTQRWRIGAAFGAAALIHFAAIVLADRHPHDPAVETPAGNDGFPPIEIVEIFPTPESTPPPEIVEPLPTLHPPDESFVDERPITPPVRRQSDKRVAPIAAVRKAGTAGPLNLSSAKVLALHAPRPEYPYEARRQKITGSGIVAMTVDPASGRVTEASMWQSTGNAYLDNAAITGFRRWRFQPGTAFRIKSPITYTLTGAAY